MHRRLVSVLGALTLASAVAVAVAPSAVASPVSAAAAGTGVLASAPPNVATRISAFPVRGGIGVAWGNWEGDGFLPTAYRVERLDGASWVDASGPLAASARSWADLAPAAGVQTSYRVVATNAAGDAPASVVVVGTRPISAPAAGAVSGLDLDAGSAGESSVPRAPDVVDISGVTSTDPVDVWPTSSDRALVGAGVVYLPRDLPGPGTYQVSGLPTGSQRLLRVSSASGPSCDYHSEGVLVVDEVLFRADLSLEVFTASYDLDCGAFRLTGDLRWRSTQPLRAVRAGPAVDAGSHPVGSSSPQQVVRVDNVGTGPVSIGAPSVTGAAAADWQVVGTTCGSTLAAASSCDVNLTVTPSGSDARAARLRIPDSSPRGEHQVALTANGTSVPGAPTALRAHRLPGGGVELQWTPPVDFGGVPFSAYRIYRTSGAGTSVFQTQDPVATGFVDAVPPSGSTYRVALVNTIGEGPQSAAATPAATPRDEAFLVTASSVGTGVNEISAALDIPDGQRLVPLPPRAGQRPVGDGWALSPDGREVLSARNGTTSGGVLWRETVSGAGTPVAIATTPDPVAGRPAWSPDGQRYAMTTRHPVTGVPTVRVGAVAGGDAVTIEAHGQPAWLPDSRTLVASPWVQDGPLAMIDGLTGQVLGTVPGTNGAARPTVSPDGKWLAFASNGGFSATTVRVMPLHGGTARAVGGSHDGVHDLSWSPSGTTLAMVFMDPGPGTWIGLAHIDASGSPAEVTSPYADRGIHTRAALWVGPRVAIGPSPAFTEVAPTLTLQTAAVPGAVLTCAVDGGSPAPCSGTYTPGVTTAGTHTVRVRAVEPDGTVTVAARTFTLGKAYTSVLTPLASARLLDTRSGVGAPAAAVPANGSARVSVTGRGGVPSVGVSAVVLNLTVTQPERAGHLVAHAGGSTRPSASNVNFVAGQTVPNLAVVPVAQDGTISLSNVSSGATHLIADVVGAYTTAVPSVPGGFATLAPGRVLDTRNGTGAPQRAVTAGAAVRLQVSGRAGVPKSGVKAVVVNLTVTQPQRAGHLIAHAGGTARPSVSNVNFTAGQTVPNLAVVPVAADGTISLANVSSGTVHLVADVLGYHLAGTPSAAGTMGSVTPNRLLDTRYGTGAAKVAVAANGTVRFAVTGRGGVPASGVRAVVLNVTVTQPQRAGHLIAYAGGTTPPVASNLNFVAGQTVPNLVIVPVGADGTVTLRNVSPGSAHLIADVSGWFHAGP